MELKIEYVDIDSIKPYENNPRHNEEAIPYVMNSIKEFGFKNPIIIDKNNVIIAGHTRLESAKRLGMKEVPIIHADDLTEEQVKAFRLADNKVSEQASWDTNMLDAELTDILNLSMEDFGFDMDFITDEGFGTDFDLPEGDKIGIDKVTLYFANEQTEVIEEAISMIDLDKVETFGNEHKKGNAIY